MRKIAQAYKIASKAILFFMVLVYPCQSQAQCNPNLWSKVYHPERLLVRRMCAIVTGTIVDATNGKNRDGCRHEADGDGHCWIKLDAGREKFLSEGNLIHQGGNLVFEPMCRYRVTQKDAMAVCKNWKQKLMLPPVGTHVRITGSWVFDMAHKHSEIHPVTRIEVLL